MVTWTVLGREVGCSTKDIYSKPYGVHALASSTLAQLPFALPLQLQCEEGELYLGNNEFGEPLNPFIMTAGKGCDINLTDVFSTAPYFCPTKLVWPPCRRGFRCVEKLTSRVLQRVRTSIPSEVTKHVNDSMEGRLDSMSLKATGKVIDISSLVQAVMGVVKHLFLSLNIYCEAARC